MATGRDSIVLLPFTSKHCDLCMERASRFRRCACGKVIARCGAHRDPKCCKETR